jgi:hypothetical protein
VNRKILAVALAAVLTLPAAALAAADSGELRFVGKPSVAPPTEVYYAEQVRERLVKRYKRVTGEKPPNWSIKRLRREIREERRERRERRAERRAQRAAAAAAAATGTAVPAPTEPAPAQGSASSGGAATPGHLSSIAACESGGDPGAVGGGGTYRGKYQFDTQTWQSVGGAGDPAAASEAEQDQRAAQLYAQRGSSPWPTCG